MQVVAITQNNEKVATEKTGRTGALPFIGVGWYRKSFEMPGFQKGKKVLLSFDGAMSEAQVYINGKKIGERPYGYSYFHFDITQFIKPEGENILAVRLENQPKSSRWYPGAGIYRKVQLIVKDEISFERWGTFITTPLIDENIAQVNIKSKVSGDDLKLVTEIFDSIGNLVASNSSSQIFGDQMELNLAIQNPELQCYSLGTQHAIAGTG